MRRRVMFGLLLAVFSFPAGALLYGLNAISYWKSVDHEHVSRVESSLSGIESGYLSGLIPDSGGVAAHLARTLDEKHFWVFKIEDDQGLAWVSRELPDTEGWTKREIEIPLAPGSAPGRMIATVGLNIPERSILSAKAGYKPYLLFVLMLSIGAWLVFFSPRPHASVPSDKRVEEMISCGESESVEFKAAMCRGLKEDTPKQLKENVKKAVVSFLNTHGGTVLIGVTDNGKCVGIDLADSRKRRDADGIDLYRREVEDLIVSAIGGENARKYVCHNRREVRGATIWVIEIRPVRRIDELVYYGGREDLPIRDGARVGWLKQNERDRWIRREFSWRGRLER